MNLSEPEMRVLKAMRDGAKWHSCNCPFCEISLWQDHHRIDVAWVTIESLLNGGWMARYGRYNYVLTDKAKIVLAEATT